MIRERLIFTYRRTAEVFEDGCFFEWEELNIPRFIIESVLSFKTDEKKEKEYKSELFNKGYLCFKLVYQKSDGKDLLKILASKVV